MASGPALAPVTIDELYGPPPDAGGATGDGHLAAASGARPDIGAARPWRVRLMAPPCGIVALPLRDDRRG